VILAPGGVRPVTTPVTGSIVALTVLPLVHCPGVVVLPSVMVDPTQTDDGPVIVAGSAYTVTVADAGQVPTR
jgi:hypothetical protein